MMTRPFAQPSHTKERPRRVDEDNDQFFNPSKKTTFISATLSAAREELREIENQPSRPSLQRPSRPETALAQQRSLSHQPPMLKVASEKIVGINTTNVKRQSVSSDIGIKKKPSIEKAGRTSKQKLRVYQQEEEQRRPFTALIMPEAPSAVVSEETQKQNIPLANQKTTSSHEEKRIWRELETAKVNLLNSTDNEIILEYLSSMVFSIESDRKIDFRFTRHTKRRDSLIETIGSFLSNETNPLFVIHSAKIIIYLSPGGRLQAAACKSLYLLSKNSENDTMLIQQQVIPCLFWVLHCENVDSNDSTKSFKSEFSSLLFAAGCLKHISENNEAKNLIIKSNSVSILSEFVHPNSLTLLSKELRPDTQAHSKDQVKLQQFLIQITSILRNLCDTAGCDESFVEHKVLENIIEIIALYDDNVELMFNIVRILSKVSFFPLCENIINQEETISYLLRLLWRHSLVPSIVLRVLFVLANATTDNDGTRLFISFTHNSIPSLISLLGTYYRVEEECAEDEQSTQSNIGISSKDAQAVLIKLIRLIANLSVNPRVGPKITSEEGIELLLNILDKQEMMKNEELVLNIVGAIANFSFYSEPDNRFLKDFSRIIAALSPLLLSGNDEIVLEIVRSLGNFSRFPEARTFMEQFKISDALVILLDHGSLSIVYHVVGALMNIAHEEYTENLLRKEGFPKLVEIFIGTDITDSDILVIVGKTLYNLIISSEIPLLNNTQHSLLDQKLRVLLGSINEPEEEAGNIKETEEEAGNINEPEEASKGSAGSAEMHSQLKSVCEMVLSAINEMIPL